MVHTRRVWCVAEVASAEVLAEKLTSSVWVLCAGFQVAGHSEYWFLNDSFTEDGAAEYVVVRRMDEGFVQLESITFGWCSAGEALSYIEKTLDGAFDDFDWFGRVEPRLHTPAGHDCCWLCR